MQHALSLSPKEGRAQGDQQQDIFALAAELFNLPAGALKADSGPANTPGWDSLAHINFVIGLETLFKVRLSPSDVVHMETMDATVQLIKRLTR